MASAAAAAIQAGLAARDVPALAVARQGNEALGLPSVAAQLLNRPDTVLRTEDVEALFGILTGDSEAERPVVLIINGAEALQPDAVNYFRLLSTFAAPAAPQIIFIGKPGFWQAAAALADLITASWVLEAKAPQPRLAVLDGASAQAAEPNVPPEQPTQFFVPLYDQPDRPAWGDDNARPTPAATLRAASMGTDAAADADTTLNLTPDMLVDDATCSTRGHRAHTVRHVALLAAVAAIVYAGTEAGKRVSPPGAIEQLQALLTALHAPALMSRAPPVGSPAAPPTLPPPLSVAAPPAALSSNTFTPQAARVQSISTPQPVEPAGPAQPAPQPARETGKATATEEPPLPVIAAHPAVQQPAQGQPASSPVPEATAATPPPLAVAARPMPQPPSQPHNNVSAAMIAAPSVPGAQTQTAAVPPAQAPSNRVPEAVAVPRPPAREQEVMALVVRGDVMLSLGDVTAARLLYERAANAGNARAAAAVGKTYDPAFLTVRTGTGPRPDREKALVWYRRAAALGDPDAPELLIRLSGKPPAN
ncbi:MAG: hypothetical protein ACJ8AI_33955 [Rhodopila sp.]